MHKTMSQSWMTWHKQAVRRNTASSRNVQRHRWGQPMTANQAQLCYVYLLVHRDEPRFKIGISKSPFSRLKSLPEHADIAPENSFQAELPSRLRASQVEKGLHRLLAGLRLLVVDESARQSNGNTEWFAIQGLSLAINILQNTPMNEEGGGEVALRRLEAELEKPSMTPCASEARARRQFDAAQANISRMNDIVKVIRRLNDEITITWRQAEAGAKPEEIHELAEMVCLHGLGNLWEPETLAFRYRLTDSSQWMFDSGKRGKALRQVSWLKRIEFDEDRRATLLLFVEDRTALTQLPGGKALLRMWDGLWSG